MAHVKASNSNMDAWIKTVGKCACTSPIVELVVGTEPYITVFRVYKDLLCLRSEYFRRMLEGDCVEAQTNRVVWEDEEAAVAKLFVSWLYTNTLDVEDHEVDINPSHDLDRDEDIPQLTIDGEHRDEHKDERGYFMVFLKLWIFADRRAVPVLANSAISAFHQFGVEKKCVPLPQDIIWAWRNTASSSKLRNFLVDCTTFWTRLDEFNHEGYNVPASFTTALVRRSALFYQNHEIYGNSSAYWDKVDLCIYHEHTDGKDCQGEALVQGNLRKRKRADGDEEDSSSSDSEAN